MTSATETLRVHSPRQANSTPKVGTMGLQARGETAWIDRFANQAVSHMAASGVMSIKHALEYLLEEDSKQPERDTRG